MLYCSLYLTRPITNLDDPFMRLLTSIKTLIALSLVYAAGNACACQKQEWKDFSTVSFSTGSAGRVTLARFTDGIYAKIEDQKGTKEMYRLNGGASLYRGLSAADEKGPSPFFMLDMPVGMVLSFLGEQFPDACAVAAEAPFSYARPMGEATINVKGSAKRESESAVSFDFEAVEQRPGGATIAASGKVEFLALGPVPRDTVISDWSIERKSAGIGLGQMTKTVGTIKDLEKLLPE